jgi:hypothetical protein
MQDLLSGRPATATALAMLLALTACGPSGRSASNGSPRPAANATGAASLSARETPVAPEVNPPGDIPDSQVFVKFDSGSYGLQVPEGWARSTRGANVTFRDKFDGLSVELTKTPPSLESIKSGTPAGSDFTSTAVTLPGGRATKIRYSSNSEADPVTGKRVRLANEVLIFNDPRPATLRLWAPLGADNVDQWNFIERHFFFRFGTI